VTAVVHNDASLAVCVGVLAEAFEQEPTVLRFCGQDKHKRTAWFDALLSTQMTLPGQRILASRKDRPAGVAVATAPGAQPTRAAQISWSWCTVRNCGPRTFARTVAYIQETERWRPRDAWTLEFVGVLPEARGHRVARQLVDRAQASHPGIGAFLSTADPRNVALYRKWGFVVSNEAVIAGLRVAGMTRPGTR
jgi:GNAT superfamily N-acetyltransferase